MADCTPGKIVSLDFGSTHVAPAVFGAEGPEEIEMGKTKIDFGDEIPCSLYPTTLIFPEELPKEVPKKIPAEGTGIELAGYRPLTNRPVAYGIKQSLDLDLCKSGSQGALIRTHFASHGPVEEVLDDSLTKIFRRIWEQVDKHRQKKGYERPEEVWLTVPAKYARGLKGKKIQERLARCAIRGGFPGVAIGLKSEMEAVFDYLDYLERKVRTGNESGEAETQRPIRREIMVNVGGGVVDVSAVQRLKGAMQLLCTSDSRPGGISDVLTTLQAMCKTLPSGSFRLLEQHVHIMDEECRDIQIDRCTFEGKVLKMMIVDAYDEGFGLAETFVRKIPQVTKVYIFGRPPASNKLIKAVCLDRFSRLRNKMREEGHKADFEIEVLGPDIAGKGVHLGACIPFVDHPASRFHKLCFGFLISEEKRGKGKRKRRRKDSRRSIVRFQQVKAPYSDELETYWEALEADEGDPNTLTIEPHTIHADDWKPLVSMKSAETHRPVGPITLAVPMEPIKVDLKGRAGPGQKIWVRFKRKDPELHPTLYKLQVDCRERNWFSSDPDEGECIEMDLELRCDAERLLFALHDGEPAHDEDDEENEGELRSGKSTRREISNSDSEREAKRRKSRAIVGPRDGAEAAHRRQTRYSESTNRESSRKRKEGPYDNNPHLVTPRRAELLENSRGMDPGFREDSAGHTQGTSTQPDLTFTVAQKDPDANHGTAEANQEANGEADKAVDDKPQGKEPETNSRATSPELKPTDTGTCSEVLQPPQQANILQSDSLGEDALGQAEERTGRATMAQQNPPNEQNTALIGQQTLPKSPPRNVHNKAELRTLPADQGTDERLTERDDGPGTRVAASDQARKRETSHQTSSQEDPAGSLEIRQSKGGGAGGQENHALDISSSDEGEPNARRPAHILRYSQPNEETSLQATARARQSLPDRQRKGGAVDMLSNVPLRKFKGARGVNTQQSDRLAPQHDQRQNLSHFIDNIPSISISASSGEPGSNLSKAAALNRRLSLPSFKEMFG